MTKLNSTGTGLVYSTFLGGYGSYAYATAIAVDSAGRAYIAGNEDEFCSNTPTRIQACFPTTSGAVIGGTQPGGGDPQYAFVAAFDPTGAQLLYSTLFGDQNFQCVIGCGGPTYGTGVAVDANGYFYLVGETEASTLPTTAGVDSAYRCSFGQPGKRSANLARLRREVQSGHFRRWGIAGLRHLPWRENWEYRRLHQRHHHR